MDIFCFIGKILADYIQARIDTLDKQMIGFPDSHSLRKIKPSKAISACYENPLF